MSAGGRWRTRRPAAVLPWLAGLLGCYLLWPLVAFLARLPGATAVSSHQASAALAVSLETATVATALIGLLGIPAAYLLARSTGALGRVLGRLVAVPLALPPLMAGILLLEVVGPYTAVGSFFGGDLTDDRIGIVLAQVFVAAPFLVITARSAFAAEDPALEEVAATLGHHPLARFLRVVVPEAAPGLVGGLLLAWLRAFGEFGATVILAYHPYSLPVFTYVAFSARGLAATTLPVLFALAAAVLVAIPAAAPRRRRAPVLALPRPPAPLGPGGHLDIALSARAGEFTVEVVHSCQERRLAVLGASGAGKSLLLRAIAGLVPSTGAVRIGEEWLTGPPETRRIGYLPQDPALQRRRSTWQQVNFGVGTDPALAAHWLHRLGLAELAARLPAQLSGGQRRRVGLARALAREPVVLLLDEPFAGLDTPVHDRLRRELRTLTLATVSVLVTHDPDDVSWLADEVLILDDGALLQAGRVEEVFCRPASPRVAELIGFRNVLPGLVRAPGLLSTGELTIPADTAELAPGTPVSWGVRANLVTVGDGPFRAEVLDVVAHAGREQVVLRIADEATLLAESTTQACTVGRSARFGFATDSIVVWPRAAEPAGAIPRTRRVGSSRE
ncbi:MAG: ATP-binding cassette domain-containing protein [Mycobacteriales bacterium]